MASRAQEGQAVLRHEGDEQGPHYHQAECQVSHQREADSRPTQEPLHRQHVLRLLGPREPLLGHGLPLWR